MLPWAAGTASRRRRSRRSATMRRARSSATRLPLSFRRGRPTLRPVCLHSLADRAAGRSAHCPTSPARRPHTALRVGVCKRGVKGRDLRIDSSLLSFELPDRLTDRPLDIDRHKSPPISDHGRLLISREVTANRRPSSILIHSRGASRSAAPRSAWRRPHQASRGRIGIRPRSARIDRITRRSVIPAREVGQSRPTSVTMSWSMHRPFGRTRAARTPTRPCGLAVSTFMVSLLSPHCRRSMASFGCCM